MCLIEYQKTISSGTFTWLAGVSSEACIVYPVNACRKTIKTVELVAHLHGLLVFQAKYIGSIL
jgi:hypothetical protein